MENLYHFLAQMEEQSVASKNSREPNTQKDFIKKYPYNGQSLLLFDKFIIIGYEKATIKKIKNILQTQPDNDILKERTIKYSNSVEVKEYHFQKLPTVLTEINSSNEKTIIKNDSIINIVFPNGAKLYQIRPKYLNKHIIASVKILNEFENTNNIYAYLYYELICNFYCPKVICFVSDFPYFQSFRTLVENILKFESSSHLFEAVLSNVVTNTPSPINWSFTLNILPDDNKAKPFFKQLSGYPLIDFNLSIIFNILSTQTIVEIFIFTFLEIDIIFYSENIEKVNLVMFAFANLNFPFDKSPYFSNIHSVSIEAITKKISFVTTKVWPSMVGVNAKYDPTKKLHDSIGAHIAVDLDKPILAYRAKENSLNKEEADQIKSLLDLIKTVINRNEPDQDFLSDALLDLYNDLEQISKKITQKKMSTNMTLSDFFHENDGTNQIITINIQELFYNFTVRIFAQVYSQLLKEINQNEQIFYIIKKDDSYPKDIKIFMNKLIGSCKYDIFVNKFIKNHKVYNISLFFIEEFINLYLYGKLANPKSGVAPGYYLVYLNHLFDVIDRFYSIKDLVIEIEFSGFYNYINMNKKKPILNWLEYGVKQKFIQPEPLDCNQAALMKYLAFLNNLNEQQKTLMIPSRQYLKQNKHLEAISIQLIDEVEKEIYVQEFTKKDLIVSAYISTFLLTRKLCKGESMNHVKYFTKSLDIVNLMSPYTFRKYITICLKLYSALIKGNDLKGKDSTIEVFCYEQLCNAAHKYKIIPHKELLALYNDLPDFKKKILLKNFDHIQEDTKVEKYSLIFRYNYDKVFHKENYFLTLAENTGYNGYLSIEKDDTWSELCVKYENLCLSTRIYSPLKLATDALGMRDAFFNSINNYEPYAVDLNVLKDICINLLFYVKNISSFSKLNKFSIKLLLRIIAFSQKLLKHQLI